jgi:hypothetical protein
MKNAFPASRARQLFEDIADIKMRLDVSNMITEVEAAELLGIGVQTLQTYVSRGKVTEEYYTVCKITGARFYKKNKLVGL